MSRVLCIGDLHEPFCREGYLKFCVDMWNKWECDTTVFIGDIADNHYSSYHETDADGFGGRQEFLRAKDNIALWAETFPEATVVLGNHDRMPKRKAQSGNIVSVWVRDYADVWETRGWDYVHRAEIDSVQYIHGEGGTARARCVKDNQSTVQGHLHTQCYSERAVGSEKRIFGMQVGCGIDKDAYAMAYAKNFPRPALACGIILDGEDTINAMMPL